MDKETDLIITTPEMTLKCGRDCVNGVALRHFLEGNGQIDYSFEAQPVSKIELLRESVRQKYSCALSIPEHEKPTPEAWEDYRRRMREIRTQLNEKCTQVFGPREGIFWYNDKICAMDRRLKKVVNQGRNVLAWHVMCGSTTSYEDTPLLDLPKPYSVEDLIYALMAELENIKLPKHENR